MTMNAEQRNELDRVKHTKATRVTLYELGFLVAALNVADKLAGIWTKYAEIPLPVAVVIIFVIGLILVTSLVFMGFMREKDRKVFALLEEELKDAAQTEGSS